jgi:hypothetical protein
LLTILLGKFPQSIDQHFFEELDDLDVFEIRIRFDLLTPALEDLLVNGATRGTLRLDPIARPGGRRLPFSPVHHFVESLA